MAARLLCFVALSEPAPARAAALAAIASAGGHDLRPLPLAAADAPPAIRAIADRLAEYLHLRSVAHELATLAMLVTLLREPSEPVVVADLAGTDALVRLIGAADLARDRLAHERPPAGASTLAAQRAASGGAELPVLAAAAAAGDLLRAPELTALGLIGAAGTGGTAAGVAARDRAERQLALVGIPHHGLLSEDPAIAAIELIEASPRPDLTPLPTLAPAQDPVLHVPLADPPADLRAVRAGSTIALHSSGATRRLEAPLVLGARVPSDVTADAGGLQIALPPAAGGPE